jgi:hypothetical protein
VKAQRRLLLPVSTPGRALVGLLWVNVWFAVIMAFSLLVLDDKLDPKFAESVFPKISHDWWSLGWTAVIALTVWGMASTRFDRWRLGLLACAGMCVMWAVALLVAGAPDVNPTAPAAFIAIAGIDFCSAAFALDPRTIQRWFASHLEGP